MFLHGKPARERVFATQRVSETYTETNLRINNMRRIGLQCIAQDSISFLLYKAEMRRSIILYICFFICKYPHENLLSSNPKSMSVLHIIMKSCIWFCFCFYF